MWGHLALSIYFFAFIAKFGHHPRRSKAPRSSSWVAGLHLLRDSQLRSWITYSWIIIWLRQTIVRERLALYNQRGVQPDESCNQMGRILSNGLRLSLIVDAVQNLNFRCTSGPEEQWSDKTLSSIGGFEESTEIYLWFGDRLFNRLQSTVITVFCH